MVVIRKYLLLGRNWQLPPCKPTLDNGARELRATTCQFVKLFKHRVQHFCIHGPYALLNTTPINRP